MTVAEILAYLNEHLPSAGLQMDEINPAEVIRVPAESLRAVAAQLRDDERLAFDSLMCLSGLEMLDGLWVVYHLYSNRHRHKVAVRCGGAKGDGVTVPSVADIWPATDWHEREAYDMFGITFAGHPDHRRILCPDDWEGFPLLKDYQPQTEWHGIPLTSLLPPGAALDETESGK